VWHVWESAEVRCIQGLVGKPGGKRLLGGPWRRWDITIKMDFQEVVWEGREWIDLVQDRERWRARR